MLTTGVLASRKLVKAIRPNVAIGFGGYPTVPPMLAAARAKVPTIIHEQNAVLGRANKYLAPKVTKIATSFAKVGKAELFTAKMVQTGNPVRPAVRDAARIPYPARGVEDPFNLLVFGGSQGARVMAELAPPAIAKLDASLRARLRIVQQCRPEDMERVAAAYRAAGVAADLQPFFRDLPARIAASHLVLSRSGASTVAELGVIGRPAIMVPLPHALDQDQKANAMVLSSAGGGWTVEQRDMTPDKLAGDLAELILHPDRLASAAASARLTGKPDAVERLADLVEQTAAPAPQAIHQGVPA
jgi:UDP-N-acetylglucosamine--N-acetylmuramyl-(pentapeptide) pyrophosphoryl-undecaprenol N-acetylglucosamine transferase